MWASSSWLSLYIAILVSCHHNQEYMNPSLSLFSCISIPVPYFQFHVFIGSEHSSSNFPNFCDLPCPGSSGPDIHASHLVDSSPSETLLLLPLARPPPSREKRWRRQQRHRRRRGRRNRGEGGGVLPPTIPLPAFHPEAPHPTTTP